MKRSVIWIVVIVVILIGLMMWGRTASEDAAGHWEDTNVLCLPSGHANVAYHIHPTLNIFVNGEAETIPANIGVNAECMAEIHTHDATGKIHIETTSAGRNITLGDFFAVWDKNLEREGFETEVTVNGESLTDPLDFIPQDLDAIVVNYISTDETPSDDVSTTSEESVE